LALTRKRCGVTVKAATPCRLLVHDAESLHRLIASNPLMAEPVDEVGRI
jgi:CRP-like cAMP-binding protein